jgi:thiosulfate/3-mercaptopyruvate sulfurtransferase
MGRGARREVQAVAGEAATHAHPESLISTEELAVALDAPSQRIVDIRWYTGGQRDALAEYAEAHIPGAVFLDWQSEMSDPDNEVPMMIAGPERFAALMERLGIGDETTVVVYDHETMSVAARLWWALRYYGHDDVKILDGGIGKWRREGRPLSAQSAPVADVTFTARARPEVLATKSQARATLEQNGHQLVETRGHRSVAAGTIAGAAHVPMAGILDPETRTLLSAEQIRNLFEEGGIDLSKPVTTFCGAGVAAAGAAFALHMAGVEDVAVYDGSWLEWSRDPEALRTPPRQ